MYYGHVMNETDTQTVINRDRHCLIPLRKGFLIKMPRLFSAVRSLETNGDDVRSGGLVFEDSHGPS